MHGVNDPSEIEKRIGLYEKIRRNRASSIQVLSNFGYDETAPPELAEFLDAEGEAIPSKIATNTLVDTANQLQHSESMGDMVKLAYGHDVVKRTVETMTAFDPKWKLPEGFFPAASRTAEATGVSDGAPHVKPGESFGVISELPIDRKGSQVVKKALIGKLDAVVEIKLRELSVTETVEVL